MTLPKLTNKLRGVTAKTKPGFYQYRPQPALWQIICVNCDLTKEQVLEVCSMGFYLHGKFDLTPHDKGASRAMEGKRFLSYAFVQCGFTYDPVTKRVTPT